VPTKVTHKEICTATAKIGAYLRCSDMEKAKEWASTLVGYLVTMQVYPVHYLSQFPPIAEKSPLPSKGKGV
jgi:hypothetical protein